MQRIGMGQTGVAVSRRPFLAFGIVVLAAFMDMLDVSVLNVVIPVIQHDLGATYAAGQWFLVAYILAFSMVLVTGGRLGDVYGRKRVFLIGVAGFTLASLACGLAPSAPLLIIARLVQGGFGALMVPQVLALLQVIFPPGRRGTAFIIYGGVINLAQLSGPILGGFLATYDLFGLGWRPIFLVNVPIGVLVLVGVGLLLRESRSEDPLRVDGLGVVLASLAGGLFVFPLLQGRELGWPAWVLACLAVSLILLAVFVWWQGRLGHQALVPLSLFRRRSFSAGAVLIMLTFSGLTSAWLIIVWHTQIGLGWTALRTGLSMLGWVVGICLFGVIAVTRAERVGRRLVGIGMLTLAVGMAAVSLVIGWRGPDLTPWQLFAVMFIVGCGMGLVIPILVNVVLGEVPRRDAGVAGGVATAVMQFAAAIGVVVVSLIFFGLLSSGANTQVNAVEPGLRAELAQAGVATADQNDVVAAVRRCVIARTGVGNPFDTPRQCGAPELDRTPARQAVATATRLDFGWATSRTLWYQVAAMLLGLALTPLLPRHAAPAEN